MTPLCDVIGREGGAVQAGAREGRISEHLRGAELQGDGNEGLKTLQGPLLRRVNCLSQGIVSPQGPCWQGGSTASSLL